MLKRKKGDMNYEQFFFVFGLVLAVTVGVAFFLFVSDVAEQTIFEKHYLARDISLTMNTIYAASGNVVYTYPEAVSHFNFKFDNSTVKVFRTDEEYTKNNIFYHFGENKYHPKTNVQIEDLKENDRIKISKKETIIIEKYENSNTE